MTTKRYHGWIVVEEASPGYNPVIYVEYTSGDNKRRRTEMDARGNRGCTEAIKWWDKKLGEGKAKLEPTIRGCYRVYTEEATLICGELTEGTPEEEPRVCQRIKGHTGRHFG